MYINYDIEVSVVNSFGANELVEYFLSHGQLLLGCRRGGELG